MNRVNFLEKTTHCVQLTQSTIDANQRLFDEGEAVPEKAFTMGIKSIMQSKHILLIANGEKKAQIIRRCILWSGNSKGSGFNLTVTQ